MASSVSILKTSEETFEYNCTACAEDDLIKQALKYCVECQKYCCKDCLTSHRRFDFLKGHSFLENLSVKPQGQPRGLPAFPTKQCSQHVGKIMDMYCQDHDAVCCYICVAEDHRLCYGMMSVSDNIDQLYNKSDTSRITSDLSDILDYMIKWQTHTNTLLQQLQDSKTTAIKEIKEYRIEMEKVLKKLEEASIKEIDEEYKKLEPQILEERKICEDYIDDLKKFQQLFAQASGNIAQQFVCTKLAKKKCTTIGDDEMKREKIHHATVTFLPSEELKSSLQRMVHLGQSSAILSRKNMSLYTATKMDDINVLLDKDNSSNLCIINGSCIADDTVIFSDYMHNKLKRFDVSSLSLIDYCEVSDPHGICRVEETELAVACKKAIQFVSIVGQLSLSHSIKMKHESYGIAYNNDQLYITDGNKSLYMYDMNGKLLKTISSDNSGQSLFESNKLVTFNDKSDRLFVADSIKGLVCFNAQCDFIKTITYSGVCPGLCVDSYGNIIVPNSGTIVQCDRDGQKCGIIVSKTSENPYCVCIHYRLRKMFVGFYSNTVEVYKLTWKYD